MQSAQGHSNPIGVPWRWMIGISIVFVLLVWPAIFAGGGGTSQANDMIDYHALEIRRLASQLPAPDLRDSFSATTPGFHLVLATLARAGLSAIALRIFASVAALTAWLVVFRVGTAWVGCAAAALFTAPLALSPYLLGSAIWITTDATAFALAAATIGVALVLPRSARTILILGVLGAGTVLVRQIFLWACMPAMLRMFFNRAQDAPQSLSRRVSNSLRVALPAVACVAAFFVIWGGSMPPRFQPFHQATFNPAAMVMTLAVIGAWGIFLVPGMMSKLDRPALARCVVIGVIAMLLCASVRSDYRKVLPLDAQRIGTPTEKTWGTPAADVVKAVGEVGRWGGPLWDLAKSTPSVGGRSCALVGLAGVGACVLCALATRANRRGRGWQAGMLLAAIAAMTIAQSLNAQTFQRYFDPWALLAIAWLTAMGLGFDARGDRWCLRATALLAVMQFAMTWVAVLKPAFSETPLPLW